MHFEYTVPKLWKGSLNPSASKGSNYPKVSPFSFIFSLLVDKWLILYSSNLSPHVFVLLPAFIFPIFTLSELLSKAFRTCMDADQLFLHCCSYHNLARTRKQTSSENPVWLLLISNLPQSLALSQIYNIYVSNIGSLLANNDREQWGFTDLLFSGRMLSDP